MNNVIVHYHIFKNAGSTIDWILKKNFGDLARAFDGADPEGTLPNHTILDYLSKNPDSKAVSSHQLRLPLPKSDNYNLIPILFIRHPFDRAFSVYSYFRRTGDDYIFSVKARTLDMKEFFDWYFKTDNPTMRNLQTIYLTKRDFFDKLGDTDYEFAVERMRSIPILGVVERMDESLVVAEKVLANAFSKIDCSYVMQNVSPDRSGNYLDRISLGLTRLGDTLAKQLEESNTLDISLHKEANSILNERIDMIDDFDEKLLDLRNRCKKLQNRSS